MKGAADAAPEPPWTCSECGRIINKHKHLRRTRRRLIVAIPCVVALLLALYGWTARDRVIARGWIGAIPTAVLMAIPGLHDEHTLPGVLSDNGRWLGVPPPPTWRDDVRAERDQRLRDGQLLALHSSIWARTIQRDLAQTGIQTLNIEQPLLRWRPRVDQHPTASPAVVARVRVDALARQFRHLTPHWTNEDRRGRILSILSQACSGASLIGDFRDTHRTSPPMIDEPRALSVTLGSVVLFVGPPSAVSRARACAQRLEAAAQRPEAVPAESQADWEATRALHSIFLPALASNATLDDIRSAIATSSGRTVHIAPQLSYRGWTLPIPWATSIDDACRELSEALTGKTSHDRFHWTHSPAGIEIGNRRHLWHLVEPRVYSLEPFLEEFIAKHRDTPVDRAAEMQRVIDALIARSATENWIEIGGNVHSIGPVLVVYSTPWVHGQVACFLTEYAATDREPAPPLPPKPTRPR